MKELKIKLTFEEACVLCNAAIDAMDSNAVKGDYKVMNILGDVSAKLGLAIDKYDKRHYEVTAVKDKEGRVEWVWRIERS